LIVSKLVCPPLGFAGMQGVEGRQEPSPALSFLKRGGYWNRYAAAGGSHKSALDQCSVQSLSKCVNVNEHFTTDTSMAPSPAIESWNGGTTGEDEMFVIRRIQTKCQSQSQQLPHLPLDARRQENNRETPLFTPARILYTPQGLSFIPQVCLKVLYWD
ncbi:hypothetical protein J6590_011530, partial [Homalodisca vitripennis]